MGKTCCPSGTMINVGGIKVGLVALDDIFKKLYEAGKKPEDIKRDELLSEFSICNYIPSEAENEYAEALMEEYKKYYDTKVNEYVK